MVPAKIASLLSGLVSSAGDTLSAVCAWLLLAFFLGLVHAFDADHVMAVSVFATRKKGVREGVHVGLRWAAGHGLVLVAVGLALLLLGHSLPSEMLMVADRLVGLAMILLGATVWIDLARRRTHIHFHAHDDLPSHAHWHTHQEAGHGHEHGPLMIGALHGLAGSAPILAVLPVAARSPALGFAYLMLFALGVALAMAVVSGLIGHLVGQSWSRLQAGGLSMLRACCASGSIALGVWLATAG